MLLKYFEVIMETQNQILYASTMVLILAKPLAKPWLSKHIVAMQKEKKRIYKNFLLTRSQEHWACYKNHDRLYTRSLRRSRTVYEQNVIASAIRNPKVLFRYIREGTKKETLSPG